ncbi:MAG: SEL1-like repeat protein [Syntrophaceae bacterium]|nr:SEL1-like repeat protein [Syntrophaceae bacterium]
MKNFMVTCIVILVFAANAKADFKAGVDAYGKKDYKTAIKEFQLLADQGNADAQYMLGYMYASGKGVLQDYIEAHMWFNLAAAQGKDRAVEARDKIAEVMAPQQIAEAQRLAREWKPKVASDQEAMKPFKTSEKIGPTGAALIREIQKNLTALGYDPGPADGVMGNKTHWAIRDYQKQAGLPIDGEPSPELLEQLKKERQNLLAEEKAASSSTSGTSVGINTAPEPQMQEVIDQLKKIVRKGENERRADSDFLEELYDLIKRYDWPWRNQLFHDDFQDGDLTRNPAWNVVSGDFWIDSNNRLVSQFKNPEQKRETSSDRQEEDTGTRILKGILGEILKERADEPSRTVQPTKAEIYSSANITNSFSMDIELMTPPGENDARLEIGPFKGTRRDDGYRLIYNGGETATFELARLNYRGFSIIEVSKPVPLSNDSMIHAIRWQRYSDGSMVISVDGKEIIRTIDRSFQDSFDGFTIVNYHGNFAFMQIDIFGTQN